MDRETDSATFAPSGYCPRCDYRTDVGTCTECGTSITPGMLRRRPRGFLRRHWRLMTLVAIVAIGGLYYTAIHPNLLRMTPTFVLLRVQGSDGSWSNTAATELVRRFRSRGLTKAQTSRFARQWGRITWEASGLLHGVLFNRPQTKFWPRIVVFLCVDTAPTQLTLEFRECIRAVRVDGELMIDNRARTDNCSQFENVSKSNRSPVIHPYGLWSGVAWLHPSVVSLVGLEPGSYNVGIETIMTVTEVSTGSFGYLTAPRGAVVATWPQTHKIVVEILE